MRQELGFIKLEVQAEREQKYYLAARAAGGGRIYRIRHHVLPNVSGTVITAVTLQIPWMFAAEAAIAFHGFGDPLLHSWGTLIEQGLLDLTLHPWVTLLPGTVLSVSILGCYLFGDALRQAFDPSQ